MMEFVLLTLSITMGVLLASVVSTAIIFMLFNNKKVVKWYMKWFVKYMKQFEDFDYEALEEEL